MRPVLRPRSNLRSFAIAAALALSSGSLLAQQAVITGRVTGEQGQPLSAANVFITEMSISVGANEEGAFRIVVPAERVKGQSVLLRARAIGHTPLGRQITLSPGDHVENFSLKQDVNRLSDVVVTGTVGEGTERSKVPYAVSRLTQEDIPVPAVDPITALAGKMPGVRIAQTSGRPGSNPEIMMRGPHSINATGRSQQPLIVVDGVVMNVGSLDEVGGLDIESVEVVKGAAGAALYGSTAANGVIVIKTKRGGTQEGVKFNVRSEYGISDVNSFDYGQPVNHNLQIDESGKRFCVAGSGVTAPCSRTIDWMKEMYRINNVAADTTRTQQSVQWASPSRDDGSLQNVFQSQIWPGQYYNSFAQIATPAPVTINSIDASGKAGTQTRYFVSAAYTDNQGAIKGLDGQNQLRGRVNLDYNPRQDVQVQVSSVFDKGRTDLRSNNGAFGSLLRGAPAGTDYLARDTLGRYLVRGGGTGFRPTSNGQSTFLYDSENQKNLRTIGRYIGNVSTSYFPAEWLTLDANFAYDNRSRNDENWLKKGYRTVGVSSSQNFGQMQLTDVNGEAYNGSFSANFRKSLMKEMNNKLQLMAHFERVDSARFDGSGQQFAVKDVYRLTNTITEKTSTSSRQTTRAMGLSAAMSTDYKDRYVFEAALRYDGSSRFGSGNRWAPFGRVSGVWRVSQEPFWHFDDIVSDFRLRASRGTAGNTPSFDAQYETYTVTATGITLGQAGNKQLKPETTDETELGTEFTLFHRLGVEFTHAFSTTKDQILNVGTPSSLGFQRQWQNAGTLSSKTFELGLNLPVVTKKDFSWSMRGTWDRTRTYISELFAPEYVSDAGTAQGSASFFLITARKDKSNGIPANRFGNIWGRRFYRGCGSLPEAVRSQCGPNQQFQVNNQGWVVWVGPGNTWKDGITRNLWQTKLPAAQSPWNYPLWFGMPIIDRPLRGQPGEGTGIQQIIGNVLPDFRFTYGNNIRYKRLTAYALLDGTIGHEINNQGEGWGLLDFSSSYFDQGGATVETAKPVGYTWRAGGAEAVGVGGFYDLLGPNNYNTESGSFAKVREVSLSYQIGRIRGVGDWTIGFTGRNLYTFTKYSGYDPEVGATGGNNESGSGLINQIDAFGFPTLRQFTFTVNTRF
jgi:TonB-linked SusC/RagA family outer membrane protein